MRSVALSLRRNRRVATSGCPFAVITMHGYFCKSRGDERGRTKEADAPTVRHTHLIEPILCDPHERCLLLHKKDEFGVRFDVWRVSSESGLEKPPLHSTHACRTRNSVNVGRNGLATHAHARAINEVPIIAEPHSPDDDPLV